MDESVHNSDKNKVDNKWMAVFIESFLDLHI